MQTWFEIAAGSIPGRDHIGSANLLVGRNNQDAVAWISSDEATVAVVCDGCGSGLHSEVGAQLGARLLTAALHAACRRGADPASPALWERVRLDVLARLRLLARSMGESLTQVVHDYFLFTVLGAVLTPAAATIFGLGDGLYAINGEVGRLGPYPNNEPPYLAYELLESPPMGLLHLQAHRTMPVREVQTILLATDGAGDLIEAAERSIPGKQERVGPLSQFWTSDRYFRNPDALRRRLALVNREHVRCGREGGALDREPGLLPDDTTVLVIRRRTG